MTEKSNETRDSKNVAQNAAQNVAAPKPEAKTETTLKPTEELKDEPTEELKDEDGPLFEFDASAFGGSRGSRRNGSSCYTLVRAPAKQTLPNQALVVWKIIYQALTKKKPYVTEAEIEKLVEAAQASGQLETSQEPMRIFRYYRGRLENPKEGNCLRRVMITDGKMTVIEPTAAAKKQQ